MEKSRVGFVTCVELGLSCMRAIYEAGGSLDLIVTLKDEIAPGKSGRVLVDDFAARNNVPLLKISHVNDSEAVERFRELDWLFIIGWSQIAGIEVLKAPRLGVIGIHPTLLPQGRGRAAIPWAILKRLPRTGVTMFKLDEGVDTGPVLAQQEIPLSAEVTATELYSLVNSAHIQLIKSVLPKLLDGTITVRPQDESLATSWPGRRPEDGRIDESGSVRDAECLVRAVTHPYPGAFFEKDGRKVVIWAAKLHPTKPDGPHLKFDDGYLELLDTEIAEI